MPRFHLVHGEPDNVEYGEVAWKDGERVSDERIDPEDRPDWMAEHFPWVLETQED